MSFLRNIRINTLHEGDSYDDDDNNNNNNKKKKKKNEHNKSNNNERQEQMGCDRATTPFHLSNAAQPYCLTNINQKVS
jgi:hypothetical protein